MSYRDPEEENIKNDFAPNMRNEYFSINGIIHCLRHGFMQINKLPPELAKVVQEEIRRSVDLHKEDIPREFVNPTLMREKVSIWDVVQLIGHGACNLSSMPKEIRAKVDAELDRRHQVYEAKKKKENGGSID